MNIGKIEAEREKFDSLCTMAERGTENEKDNARRLLLKRYEFTYSKAGVEALKKLGRTQTGAGSGGDAFDLSDILSGFSFVNFAEGTEAGNWFNERFGSRLKQDRERKQERERSKERFGHYSFVFPLSSYEKRWKNVFNNDMVIGIMRQVIASSNYSYDKMFKDTGAKDPTILLDGLSPNCVDLIKVRLNNHVPKILDEMYNAYQCYVIGNNLTTKR